MRSVGPPAALLAACGRLAWRSVARWQHHDGCLPPEADAPP